jgi:transcriptional regulator NrdR family protein
MDNLDVENSFNTNVIKRPNYKFDDEDMVDDVDIFTDKPPSPKERIETIINMLTASCDEQQKKLTERDDISEYQKYRYKIKAQVAKKYLEDGSYEDIVKRYAYAYNVKYNKNLSNKEICELILKYAEEQSNFESIALLDYLRTLMKVYITRFPQYVSEFSDIIYDIYNNEVTVTKESIDELTKRVEEITNVAYRA